MNIERRVRKLNDRLGSDLGRNIFGEPLYQWMFSEELMHPMRVKDKYDYKAAPDGLLVAVPVFELRKMALHLEGQWVLCKWFQPVSEEKWRAEYGYNLEWPRRGEYYPTNVDLDKGLEPDLIITELVIGRFREHAKKKAADVVEEATVAAAKRDKQEYDTLYNTIREDLPTYDHIPGTAGGIVSYPNITKEAN